MKVVHCKMQPFTHYIGRPSIFGNPFPVERYGRDACIRSFEVHARKTSIIMAAIEALPDDAILGCWCFPRPCHGDVIVKLWKELHDGEARR